MIITNTRANIAQNSRTHKCAKQSSVRKQFVSALLFEHRKPSVYKVELVFNCNAPCRQLISCRTSAAKRFFDVQAVQNLSADALTEINNEEVVPVRVCAVAKNQKRRGLHGGWPVERSDDGGVGVKSICCTCSCVRSAFCAALYQYPPRHRGADRAGFQAQFLRTQNVRKM